MGDIDNPNNMIIIPPLPGRQLRLRKRKKRRLIKTSLSQQWPLLFASLLQYVFDYNVTNELFYLLFLPLTHTGKRVSIFFSVSSFIGPKVLQTPEINNSGGRFVIEMMKGPFKNEILSFHFYDKSTLKIVHL